MSQLSDRIRPGVEAAPWVVDAVKVLEAELAAARGSSATESPAAPAGGNARPTMPAITDAVKPEALRLADSIERMDTFTQHQRRELLAAADCLRRQHATLAEPVGEPVAWRRREKGGRWQYFGWQDSGMTHELVSRWNSDGFECEAIPSSQHPALAHHRAEVINEACALIKAADDAAAEGDYMLDSNDCIKVLRGEWRGPVLNDHPARPLAPVDVADAMGWTPREVELLEGMIAVQLHHAAQCEEMIGRNNGNHPMAQKQKDWDLERVELLQRVKLKGKPASAMHTGLDPEMGFILHSANKGEWAAYDYAVASHCAAVLDILDGKDTGAGANNEPWATVRKRLLALVNQHSAPAAPDLLAYAKCEEARANGEDIAETVLKQYGFDPSRGSATEFMDNMRRAAIAKAQGTELAPSSSPSAVGSLIRRKVGAR